MNPQYGFCFRPALGRGNYTGQVMLWLSYRGATCFVARCDVHPNEWDALSGSIVPPDDDAKRARQLTRYSTGMKRDLRRMTALVRRLDPGESYSARHIIDMWERESAEPRRQSLRAAH